MTEKKRSREDILADLHARREGVREGSEGEIADMAYVTQQITAHETLMRLEEERAELEKEKLSTLSVDTQIRFWRTMADPDPFAQPKTVAAIDPGATGAPRGPVAKDGPAIKDSKKS